MQIKKLLAAATSHLDVAEAALAEGKLDSAKLALHLGANKLSEAQELFNGYKLSKKVKLYTPVTNVMKRRAELAQALAA